MILDLKDVFFLPSSPSNLTSLALLNNYGIFNDNENETLYDLKTKEVLAQAKRWNKNFLLQPLNLGRSSEPSQDSQQGLSVANIRSLNKAWIGKTNTHHLAQKTWTFKPVCS